MRIFKFFKSRQFAWYLVICRTFQADDQKMVSWNVRHPVLSFVMGELYLMLVALRFSLLRRRLLAAWLALNGEYPNAL